MQPTPRIVFAAIVVASASLLGTAIFYFQQELGLEPCPMCILSRYSFIAIAVIALAGAIHGPKGLALKVYAGLIALFAVAGIGVSVRHSYLQHFPPKVESCGTDLEFLLNTLPLTQALPKIFAGHRQLLDGGLEVRGPVDPRVGAGVVPGVRGRGALDGIAPPQKENAARARRFLANGEPAYLPRRRRPGSSSPWRARRRTRRACRPCAGPRLRRATSSRPFICASESFGFLARASSIDFMSFGQCMANAVAEAKTSARQPGQGSFIGFSSFGGGWGQVYFNAANSASSLYSSPEARRSRPRAASIPTTASIA